jgi:hypothetical protein
VEYTVATTVKMYRVSPAMHSVVASDALAGNGGIDGGLDGVFDAVEPVASTVVIVVLLTA